MDISPWLTGVTGLANLLKAWFDARASGLKVEELRLRLESVETSGAFTPTPEHERQQHSDIVISSELLKAFQDDIQQAERRFAGAINDPRYTPADIDRESERARISICTHLKRIREYNANGLPTPELERAESSYGCRNT